VSLAPSKSSVTVSSNLTAAFSPFGKGAALGLFNTAAAIASVGALLPEVRWPRGSAIPAQACSLAVERLWPWFAYLASAAAAQQRNLEHRKVGKVSVRLLRRQEQDLHSCLKRDAETRVPRAAR
jgi:hypothetical protein